MTRKRSRTLLTILAILAWGVVGPMASADAAQQGDLNFTGRILMPDGVTGAEGMEVRLRIYLQENHMVRTHATTDANGRFTAPLWLPGGVAQEEWGNRWDPIPYWARVSYGKTKTWDSPEPHLNLGEREDPWALGDFILKEREFLWLHAVDQEGKPIAGALARSFDFSEPTDVDGRCKVYMHSAVDKVFVACEGYGGAQRDFPEDPEQVMEFILERSAWLKVLLDVPLDVDMRGLRLDIRSQDRVFDTENGLPNRNDTLFQIPFSRYYAGGRRIESGGTQTSWSLDPDRRIFSVWNLAQKQPLLVVMIDRFGAELCRGAVLCDSTIMQTVTLKPAFPIRVFQGMVVDADGRPLASVSFDFNERPSWPEDSTTDEQGYFQYSGVGSKTVDIRVGKAGHATLVDHAYPVPLDGSSVVLYLGTPRELLVEVQDAFGRRLEDVIISRNHAWTWNEAVPQGEGHFLLEDLPRGPVPLRILVGGILLEKVASEETSFLQFEFPPMGEVRLRLARWRGVEALPIVIQCLPAQHATEIDGKTGLHKGGQRKDVLMSAASDPVVTHFDAVLPGDYVLQVSVWKEQISRYQPTERIGPFGVEGGEVTDLEKTIRPR